MTNGSTPAATEVPLPKEAVVDTKYKKIYRSILECSKKLDEIYKSPNAYVTIFQAETSNLRQKLKSYCEGLIFREPLEYGKKAEEILWRRGFYEIIHIIKMNKKKLTAEVETTYRMHLSSAYGFYNHLIMRFQSEFGSIAHVDGIFSFNQISTEKHSLSAHQLERVDLLKEVLTRILHKFLICLGDLARYQTEYDDLEKLTSASNSSFRLAHKYYQMALMLVPSNGMPLNQLGTLYTSEDYGCDSAYYYLYCLSCSEPFASARDNLKLLFAKNRKRYAELNKPIDDKAIKRDESNEESYQMDDIKIKEIKQFLVRFMYVIELFLSQSSFWGNTAQSSQSVDNVKLQELCQLCLQEFNSCMFYRPSEGEKSNLNDSMDTNKALAQTKLTYLPDDLVFKLALIILMTIDQLKSKRNYSSVPSVGANSASSIYSPKAPLGIYFTSVAFALLFFSHILNHTCIRFQSSFLEKQNSNKKLKMSLDEEAEEDEEKATGGDKTTSEAQQKEETKKVRRKKKISKSLLYARRRRRHNTDSDTEEDVESSSKESTQDSDSETTSSESDSGESDQVKDRARKTSLRNVTQFLEREDLSETELNLNELSSYSESGGEQSDNSLPPAEPKKKSELVKQTNNVEKTQNASASKTSSHEANSLLKLATYSLNDQLVTPSSFIPLAAESVLNPNAIASFKQFSTQLSARFTSLYQDPLQNSTASLKSSFDGTKPIGFSSSMSSSSMNSEDFIDNEIYRLIMKGAKNAFDGANAVPPPGFELLHEELENEEELSKKLATFQIETDSDISMFDSDNSDEGQRHQADKIKKEKDRKKTKKMLFNEQNAKMVVDLLKFQGLLPTIKVFCDWLLCNKKIIQSISQVSTTLWTKLALLLNCIPFERQIAGDFLCKNQYVKSLILKSMETKSWNHQPLTEDLLVRSLNLFKLEHLSLKFDLAKLNRLSLWDEHLIRICTLRRFGYLIASFSQSQSLSGGSSFFKYDYNRSIFIAEEITCEEDEATSIESNNNQASADADTKEVSKEKEKRKLELMKNMAQLRLEAEISQFESLYKNDEFDWSPYLVLHSKVICNELKLIQELSRSNKVIIIIPLSAMSDLDNLKKDSKLARSAIRWLESQFREGNRFLRAQNQNEKAKITIASDLNAKEDLELWKLYQLLDCCCFFQNDAYSSRAESKNMATMLLGNETASLVRTSTETRYKDFLKLTQDKNVRILSVQELNEKWKK